ncbi:hypothetical protein WAI453_007639 [Rhynchosporium graminicola]
MCGQLASVCCHSTQFKTLRHPPPFPSIPYSTQLGLMPKFDFLQHCRKARTATTAYLIQTGRLHLLPFQAFNAYQYPLATTPLLPIHPLRSHHAPSLTSNPITQPTSLPASSKPGSPLLEKEAAQVPSKPLLVE